MRTSNKPNIELDPFLHVLDREELGPDPQVHEETPNNLLTHKALGGKGVRKPPPNSKFYGSSKKKGN